jgi:hypothetical protein
MISTHITRRLLLVALFAVVAAVFAQASALAQTTQGLKADGLRLQGVAHVYGLIKGTTPEGLTADGLRLQGTAQVYKQMQSRPAASARPDDRAGARATNIAPEVVYTDVRATAPDNRPGIRGNFPASSASSPVRAPSVSETFHWGDAGIGAGSTVALALLAAGALLYVTRRTRSRVAGF